MAKTKQSKKKTRPKARPKTTTKIDREATRRKILAERFLSERILEAVKDEIADLAAVLETVPVLRAMADVIHDIQRSPLAPLKSDLSNLYVHMPNDPVGRITLRHFGVSLSDQLSRAGIPLVGNQRNFALYMHRGIDGIITAVRWRLYRLEALIEVMKKQKPRQ